MIQEIIEKNYFEDILEGNYTKSGDIKFFLCPFHEENNPSFAVYPKSGKGKGEGWYCFSCQKYGRDILDFIKIKYDVTRKEAMKLLLNSSV